MQGLDVLAQCLAQGGVAGGAAGRRMNLNQVTVEVSDIPRARAFYTGLGFTLNPQFSKIGRAHV